MSNKVQVVIKVDQSVKDRLVEVRAMSKADTNAEVFRRALALYGRILEGGFTLILRKDGRDIEVIL